jgi:hypothetical protein
MIKINYESSVYLPNIGGFRSISITAKAEKISEKRCKVVEVLDVDGEGTTGYASRTGAKRQQYNVGNVVRSEVGKVKIISRLTIIEG